MNYILIIVVLYIPHYGGPRDHSQTVIEHLSEKSCESLRIEYLKEYEDYLNNQNYSVNVTCFKKGE